MTLIDDNNDDGDTTVNATALLLSNSNDVRVLDLTDEEDKVLREISRSYMLDTAFGDRWYNEPEAWKKAKKEYPILAQYKDTELRRATFLLSPSVLDVLLKTPVGPTILANVAAYIYYNYFQNSV